MRRALMVLSAVLVLSSAGCSKVVDKKNKTLGPHEMWVLEIDKHKSGLKLEVKVEADAKVLGCIYSATKELVAQNSVANKKKPDDALAFKEGKESFTLNGTLPANEDGRIVIMNLGLKPVEAKVNIVGR